MTDEEFFGVLAASPQKRYGHFVKRSADRRELWSLANTKGWVLYGSGQGQELIAVWPHSRYAEACAQGNLAGCLPKRITLDDWLETWTADLIKNNLQVAVFPTPSMSSVIVSPQYLKQNLLYELSLIED